MSNPQSQKNDFLILGEGDTFSINESFGALKKKQNINFSKDKIFFESAL